MTLKALEEGLRHVLEMTANIEVIQCHLIIAFKVEVLEDETLRGCLELNFLKTVIEEQGLTDVLRSLGF